MRMLSSIWLRENKLQKEEETTSQKKEKSYLKYKRATATVEDVTERC